MKSVSTSLARAFLAGAAVCLVAVLSANAQDTHSVKSLAGNGSLGSADGTGTAARFGGVYQLAPAPNGDIFAADIRNLVVRRITSSGVVTTYAGQKGVAGDTDGPLSAALFRHVYGVATDPNGVLYVAQRNFDDGEMRIRRIDTSGNVTTQSIRPYNEDSFTSIAVDRNGTVYTMAGGTHLISISSTGVVTSIAGTLGAPGYVNGTGAAARFNAAHGIALDPASGDIFIADHNNYAIRRVTLAGAVTTLAGGNGKGTADGSGTTAQFGVLHGLTRDASGNLYVSESDGPFPGGSARIRRVTLNGDVTTLSGRTPSGFSDGAATTVAKQSSAQGLAIANGFVYFADSDNERIRYVCRTSSTAAASGPNLAKCPSTKVVAVKKLTEKSGAKPQAK